MGLNNFRIASLGVNSQAEKQSLSRVPKPVENHPNRGAKWDDQGANRFLSSPCLAIKLGHQLRSLTRNKIHAAAGSDVVFVERRITLYAPCFDPVAMDQ